MTEHTGRQAKRQTVAQQILVGSGLVGMICGGGYALFDKLNIVVPRGAAFAGGLVVVVGIFGASIVYWRNIDEAAREAHKFAWFWGGVGGLLMMLPIGVLISSERLIAAFGDRSPADWVTAGMMAMLVAQMIGYGLVWAGWWLRQR